MTLLFTQKNSQTKVNKLLNQLATSFKRKSRTQVLQLSETSRVDVWGLPGDIPSDIPNVLHKIMEILTSLELVWCVVGDLLLAHYQAPKITFDIQVCVLSAQLEKATSAFSSIPEFCYPFRPREGVFDSHLAPYPRFRVQGMNQCFYLVPSDHYGLTHEDFARIIYTPSVLFPLLPLPCHIQGMATVIATSGRFGNNFLSQLEFLIDGADIDEDWCNNYLTGPALPIVLNLSTRVAKRERMGTHPKYDGNITTYIHDETDLQRATSVVGRSTETRELVAPVQQCISDDVNYNAIQLMSDLHLEIKLIRESNNDQNTGYNFQFRPSSHALALLGDIGNVLHEGFFEFLHVQLSRFRKVFFVMGNHEFYGCTYDEAIIRMRMFSEKIKKQRTLDNILGEFILLDRTRYDLDENVTVLGCTLWSLIPAAATEHAHTRLKDFKRIQNWTVESQNSTHAVEVNWLERECLKIRNEEPHRRVLIFTHHAPLTHGTSAPDKQDSPIACCFATDMSESNCWGSPVELWAFGHTHYNCDFVQDGIHIISNQRGYEGIESHKLKDSFRSDLVLHI